VAEVINQLGSSFSSWLSSRTVVQELGREGILPFSSFFASNRPFNAPLAGLFTEYLVSCIYLFVVPPGDAYIFLINSKSNITDSDAFLINWDSFPVASYATTVVNTLVSFGLLLLYMPSYRIWDWNPPFRAPKTIISLYFLSNLFLVVVPFFPPASRTYEKLPYWVFFFFAYVYSHSFHVSQSHSIGSVIVTFLGITYWYIWGTWLPNLKGYRLQREWVNEEDGISRYVFRRLPRSVVSHSTWA
jgi:hypothetical protein